MPCPPAEIHAASFPAARPPLPPWSTWGGAAPRAAWRLARSAPEPRDPTAMLLATYHRLGGCATGDEVAGMLARHQAQAISAVARWIVSRSVVSIPWQSQTLLPLCQFDPAAMVPLPGLGAVLRELAGSFDDWDLAMWFSHPNSWLQHAAPAEVLPRDPAAVLGAAQADRFIARG